MSSIIMARENELRRQDHESAVARLLRLEGGLGRPAGRGALQGDDCYGAVLGVLVGDGELQQEISRQNIRLQILNIEPTRLVSVTCCCQCS